MAGRARPAEFHCIDDPDLAEVLRRDGVVLIKDFIDAEQVAELRDQLARYQRDVLPTVPRAHWHTYRDGSVHSISSLQEFDPWFAEFARSPHLIEFARRTVPWEPTVHYLESFPKPSGAAAVAAHQELYTNPIDPPHFLHLWVALEDVTAENGGLTFYPGTHKLGLAPHEVADEHMGAPRIGPDLLARLDHLRIDPDYPAGSAALFHGHMIHRSGANLSGRDRPVIIAAFRDAAAEATSERDNIASFIAEVVRGELPGQPCGLDDNLFSLGVDSLQAVRILARVRERYNVRVSLGDMFSHGTPLELADRVLEADVSDQQAVAPPSKRRSSWGPLALSQLPFYEMDRATQGAGLFNTVVDFHFRGDIDADVLREAVADVIRRQPVLRTVYRDDRSGPTQRVLDGLVVDELDLRGPDATHKFERFLLRQHRTGFDIETSPAARVTILRREDDAWSVVFTMHHIATDGWSGLVLTEDMADAYRRRMTEQDPAPVVRSYLDFARWQRDTLTGERLQSHLDYVAELLSEPSPRIGHQQPERPSYRTSVDRLELGASTMGAYTDLAQQTGTTRFATLAAAVTSFAQELTGSPRQLISIQSANRSWPGSEELVGCFSNVIHVGSPDAHLAPAELIGAVGESLAVAVSHDDVPLDYALGLLADKGIPAVEHLPGIAFASQPLLSVPVELPGCVMVATNTSQPSDGVDPTTYPLVVELADTGSGLIRRMRERWTDDAYDKARVSLVKTMTEFPATVGIRAE